MDKLLLTYQHFGDITDILMNLDDLRSHLKTDRVVLSYVVDFQISDEEVELIESWFNDFRRDSGIQAIWSHQVNQGLSPARITAFNQAKHSEGITHVLWCCSNMTWIRDIDDSFLDELMSYDVIAWTCYYSEDPWVRDKSLLKGLVTYVDFDQWFNCETKPDCFYSFRIDTYCASYINGEKYMPEDEGIHRSLNGKRLKVVDCAFAKSWYNESGMSKTFSRKTQTSNRQGFVQRASYFLGLFLEGRFNLSSHRLRNLVNDLVTLSDQVDLQKYQGTLIEPLILWTIQRWCTNQKYNHRIKFIENE